MAEKLASLRKKGGGNSVDPFVIFVRGSGYRHTCINNELLKQYKYIKLMTAQEWQDYMPVISPYSYLVNTTSTALVVNWVSNSSYQVVTLTTTPIEISTLNLIDGACCWTQTSNATDGAYVLKLYN